MKKGKLFWIGVSIRIDVVISLLPVDFEIFNIVTPTYILTYDPS